MYVFNFKKIILASFFLFIFSILHVDAATLSISSSKTTNIKVGDIITATIYVNAGGETINNIEGQLSASNLEIQSISNSDSIVNMWVEQPKATLGSASFNGGVLNPGYSGSTGKIATLSLRATQEGTGTLSFASASVRANDGLGTDVLKSRSGLSVIISPNIVPVTPPVPTPVVDTKPEIKPETTTTLNAPIIFSPATPDVDTWYNVDKVVFTWNIPSNTTSVRTLLDANSNSNPTILYDSPIQTRTISNLEDGVWYFHLQYKTPEGWSRIAHKKFKIDKSAPESIELEQKILDTGLVEIKISAFDKTSAISKFILLVPDESNIEITDISTDGEATYVFSPIYDGLKEITIKAFDNANNVHEQKFVIDFPKVEIPKITAYPSEIKKGEITVVSGESKYPNSRAELQVTLRDGIIKTYTSQTKSDGSFDFEIREINTKGEVSMFAQIFVGDSPIPISSEKVIINIVGFDIMQSAQGLLNILLVIVPIVILIALLVGVLYFIATKLIFDDQNKERRRRIKRIEKETTDLIDSLKNIIIHDIHLINADRSLTDIEEVETVLLKNLLKDFKDVEKRIANRLKRNSVSKKRIEVEEE